ncbi:MAG: c-type cytochrome biogenesis protein CcmI [Sulfuritalea sp.]|nr:c-type cytochrome biogenesis protein CcmI [Sulfuritalea sp.]
MQFLGAAALLTVLVLAWLLRPLLRGRQSTSRTSRQALNAAIYRDQLGELESDRIAGSLAAGDCEQARQELQRRLLQDAAAADEPPAAAAPEKNSALALGLLLPLGAALLYFWLGAPDAMKPLPAEHQVASAAFEDMVDKLAVRLKTSPNDIQGWIMLARSYKSMGRFDDADKAFDHVVGIAGNDANVLTEYADLLAFRAKGNFDGKPMELVNRALGADPKNATALNLAGTAAFNRQDFVTAARYWETLLKGLPPGSEEARSIVGAVAEARGKAGMAPLEVAQPAAQPQAPVVAADATKAVSGTVKLAPALAGKAQPDDTLFILARAVDGPRMPLAVLRKRVADLPLSFTLDDSLALDPQMRLSSVAAVNIEARISKSGQAMPQPGDLIGESGPLQLGTKSAKILIVRALP